MLAGAITLTASAAACAQSPATGPQCAERRIDARTFTTCDFSGAALGALRLAPAPEPAARDWTFQRLDSTLRAEGQRLTFATNAGIFGVDGRPLGLLVADGRMITPLNSGSGPAVAPPADVCDVANFYCAPNGVFFIAGGRADVLATDEFSARANANVVLATQSGPMLVRHGTLAREFPPTWRRRIVRSAACIRTDGTATLVLAEDQTPLTFATALRDSLHCRDALYLDGHISAMYAGTGAVPPTTDFAGILYVAAPLAASDSVIPPIARGAPAPYSRLVVRAGGTRLRTLDQLHEFYPGGSGYELQVETPFEFGLIGLTVTTMRLHGTTAQQVDAHTRTIAADWQGRIALGGRGALRAGVRIGDFAMAFDEPNPAPNADYGTHEFLIGPAGALDLALFGPVGMSVSGTWLYLPSSSSMHFGYVSLLGTYRAATPGWLHRILE